MSDSLAIVLAAGKGTRMESDLPKVLVPLAGRPMIDYVLDVLEQTGFAQILVVVGYKADLVREALRGRAGVGFVEQTEQLGTGHAVQVCREQLRTHDGPVLIVTGDSPLIQKSSIRELMTYYQDAGPQCILGTLIKEDPAGLGRIVRDAEGRFSAVVEEKDATADQRRINEVNMSTYVFDCQELLWALDRLSNDNQQQEYYITDCPGILTRHGKDVRALAVLKPCEALSINNMADLGDVETELRKQQCAS